MEDSVIAIYCFIDDILKAYRPKQQHHNSKLSDSEVITILIISGLYFGGNYCDACLYVADNLKFNVPDKSNFNRKCHELADLLEELVYIFGQVFKDLNTESCYVIDSFPVPVCANIRSSRCKILKDKEFRGYNASKRTYFHGFKVHVLTTRTGDIIEFLITPGNCTDIAAYCAMDIDLPAHSKVYADAAYNKKEWHAMVSEIRNIHCLAETKKNFVVQNSWLESIAIRANRKLIETKFAQITRNFPKKIHAVTATGFIIKIIVFILACTVQSFI